jgi:hypothetical protein
VVADLFSLVGKTGGAQQVRNKSRWVHKIVAAQVEGFRAVSFGIGEEDEG